jgi:hypothetical protein
MPIFCDVFSEYFFYLEWFILCQSHIFLNKDCFVQGCFRLGVFYSLIFKIGKCKGKKNLGNSYTRVILTEIYHLLGMKSSRDDLIDRMKTGWGCFVLASSLYSCTL